MIPKPWRCLWIVTSHADSTPFVCNNAQHKCCKQKQQFSSCGNNDVPQLAGGVRPYSALLSLCENLEKIAWRIYLRPINHERNQLYDYKPWMNEYPKYLEWNFIKSLRHSVEKSDSSCWPLLHVRAVRFTFYNYFGLTESTLRCVTRSAHQSFILQVSGTKAGTQHRTNFSLPLQYSARTSDVWFEIVALHLCMFDFFFKSRLCLKWNWFRSYRTSLLFFHFQPNVQRPGIKCSW